MKVFHNFNAGPCVLPKPAVESTIEAIRNFDGTGIGLLEISHRTPGWERVMKETADLWRELLNIPDNYQVLFLGGGASTQFFTVPANLLNKKAAYLQTGVWTKKAVKEAKFYDPLLELAFVLRVHRAGRLVEDDDGGVLEQRPGYRDALALAA